MNTKRLNIEFDDIKIGGETDCEAPKLGGVMLYTGNAFKISNKVEKLARKLCKEAGHKQPGKGNIYNGDPLWWSYIDAAREKLKSISQE